LSKILSIGQAVPAHKHQQQDIMHFMQQVYAGSEEDNRKLRFLYHHSGIETRHSVVPDYSKSILEWKFYPHSENLEPFPSLEMRMNWYQKFAAPLSVDAIRECLGTQFSPGQITHLITVSCTGMSAPGLDLQVLELMDLPKDIFRTSVNFMGCYAAIHALKIADAICRSDRQAKVVLVATELCTLHFQKDATADQIVSSMLFSDGSAAALIVGDEHPGSGLQLRNFYSEVMPRGKKDMAWELSSTGFLMTLSSYVPNLIEEDFRALTEKALTKAGLKQGNIGSWCIHPGGKKILDAISKCLNLGIDDLKESYEVLRQHGNMSSATILFVLKKIVEKKRMTAPVFGAAFGPGLTMETFVVAPV
jgi:predicted naringenin-chalcone synthase